jgi:hypothetical protein
MMWNANIEIERVGQVRVARHGVSPDAVAEAIHNLDGARDVTMTITPEGVAGEHLMVAIDGSRAFLGLERTDGLLQFAVYSHNTEEVHAFSIGGQESMIEGRYLPEVSIAAVVVEEWLQKGEMSAQGYWERQ